MKLVEGDKLLGLSAHAQIDGKKEKEDYGG
jgi:hypothetical protein